MNCTRQPHEADLHEVPNQPEKRRYRLGFWDGQPTRVWTPVMEMVCGGRTLC